MVEERVTASLTHQIREAIQEGFSSVDGAKLVGIYDDGYRLIVKLISICDNHKDPAIRVKASSWLKLIDIKGEIGTLYRDLAAFTQTFSTGKKPVTKDIHKQGSQIKVRQIDRLRVIAEREDIGEVDRAEAKRIINAIQYNGASNRIYVADRHKMYDLFRSYDNRVTGKRGWVSVDTGKIPHFTEKLKELKNRVDVEDSVRKQVDELLEQIIDGKMQTKYMIKARELLLSNKASKEMIRKRVAASSTFSHAITYACDACDDLSEISSQFLQEQDKTRLVKRLGVSAMALLETQRRLLSNGGKSDDGEED